MRVNNIIISRKGFDSDSGGYASPILNDGTLLSLPIPDYDSFTNYTDIIAGKEGETYHDIMTSLMPNIKYYGKRVNLSKEIKCHLDPDIFKNALSRDKEWRGMFGQINSAQTHLKNKCVNKGDIFLFFGWFRKTIIKNNKIKFDPNDKKGRHIIFGYLQVGNIITRYDNCFKWMESHPHLTECRRKNPTNAIYIASDKLSLNKEIPGYGTFKYDDKLVLTKKGETKSKWDLSDLFRNVEITYHSDKSWKKGYFQSVGRGQEFVIQANDEVIEWVKNKICSSSIV